MLLEYNTLFSLVPLHAFNVNEDIYANILLSKVVSIAILQDTKKSRQQLPHFMTIHVFLFFFDGINHSLVIVLLKVQLSVVPFFFLFLIYRYFETNIQGSKKTRWKDSYHH